MSDVVRLRWFGHVEHRGNDLVRKCTDLEVDSSTGSTGNSRKLCFACEGDDMKHVGLRKEMA